MENIESNLLNKILNMEHHGKKLRALLRAQKPSKRMKDYAEMIGINAGTLSSLYFNDPSFSPLKIEKLMVLPFFDPTEFGAEFTEDGGSRKDTHAQLISVLEYMTEKVKKYEARFGPI